MYDHHTQAAKRDGGNRLDRVQRLDLLLWYFNDDQIQRLSLLQVRHQHQPSALDLPLDECRLRFARWLVEHGLLNEGLETCVEGDAELADSADTSQLLASAGVPPWRSLWADESTEPWIESAPRTPRERWQRMLLGAWSKIRRGAARVIAFGRELGSLDYLSDESWSWGAPWGMYGPDFPDPNSPRDPHRMRANADDPWSYDPWSWIRFRHGGYF